jgi:hypothetical protein
MNILDYYIRLLSGAGWTVCSGWPSDWSGLSRSSRRRRRSTFRFSPASPPSSPRSSKPCRGKHLSRYQCCGSGTFIPDQNFFIPDPGSKRHRIPDLDPQIFYFYFYNPKNCYYAIGNAIRDVYPGFGFFPLSRIPDPAESKSTGPGSLIRIRNTAGYLPFF